MLKRGFLVLFLLLQAGCISAFLDDGCGPVLRFTIARGELREGQTTLARVVMELIEQRNASSRLHNILLGMPPGAQGAPLKGHVTAARLVHARTGATLHEIDIQPGAGDELIRSLNASVADFDALKEAALDGDLVLVITTDLPGREMLTAPLADVTEDDWRRASCS